MKKKALTKTLAITAAVWLSINSVLGGGYYWLSSDMEKMTADTAQKKAMFIANRAQSEEVAKNIKSSEIAMSRFIDFSKSDDNNRDLFRRNALIRRLGDITSQLRAVKVSFTMTPFTKYELIPSSDKVDVVFSKVVIKYEALTDITAFKILKLLTEKLSGTVYFRNFTISKRGDIDSDVLLKISNGDIPSLVEGEIDFDWISIRLKDNPTPSAPANPAAPGSPTPAIGGQNV